MSNGKVSKNVRWKKRLLELLLAVLIAVVGWLYPELMEEPVTEPTPTAEVVQTVTPNPKPVSGKLQVTMFNVGQADCFLVQQGENAILVDTATSGEIDAVIKRLQEMGITKLVAVVFTHPHDDHMGGAAKFIAHFGKNVRVIYMPDYTLSMGTQRWQTNMELEILRRSNMEEEYIAQYEKWEEECSNLSEKEQELYLTQKTDQFFVENCDVVHPKPKDVIQLGEATIQFIAPSSQKYSNVNNYSICFRLTFGDVSMLFTGDAEVLSEKEMLELGVELKSDILKVGHHGSNTSSSQEFLDAVSPQYVMISCEMGHKDENPDKEFVDRLEKGGYEVYRTDECGEVTMTTDGKNIEWSCEPGDYLSGIELAKGADAK